MRLKLIIGSAALLAIAFAVNTAFLHAALTDGYQVSEIKRHLLSTRTARDSIERVLGNNRRLSVADMRAILNREKQAVNRHWARTQHPQLDHREPQTLDLVNLFVVLKSGSKLVTTSTDKADRATPEELVTQIREISDGRALAGLGFVEDHTSYYLPYLLYDEQGRWFLSLVFQFEKDALRYSVSPHLVVHYLPTIIIALFSACGILWLNSKLVTDRNSMRKKDFVVDFVLIMLVSLACSLLTNTVIFERNILDLSVQTARATGDDISAGFRQRLAQRSQTDPSLPRQSGFTEFFGRFDNFEAITLVDDRQNTIFRYQPERDGTSAAENLLQSLVIGHLPEGKFEVSQELDGIKRKNGSSLNALIRISRDDIYRNSLAMLINGLTMLFLTVLVIIECLFLYLHLLGKRKSIKASAPRHELGFVRPAMFMFLFAIDLSMSFLPLHMQRFDSELFGLSQDIVSGLPISAEFLCVGIFLLIAGVWMDRRGWHEPFFIGLVIVGAGTLCSWITTDALLFILSRALVGVGYGLTLMSAQGLVIRYSGSNGRARGFASLFAGLYSGSICGAAAGAILAERLGYGKVFLIGAVIVLVLIAFSWRFLHSAIDRDLVPKKAEKSGEGIKLGPLLRFIGNPVFIALNLLSSLPASIAVAGFLHFFTPVYLDQIGVRDSTIGQVLILYGICLIYFGPPIGRMIDRSLSKKYFMLVGGVLGGLAFATFNTDFGIASMIISVFLLGLSSSFVLSSQSTIVLELKESRALGEGTALGIFRSISRIGQVVGPIIFGWVMLSGDLTDIINYFGYAYIGAMLVLAVFVINHPGKRDESELALQT
ncbi:MAG: MFS transporter [Gammaproteobacteria bacterium]|nr:MFS transporter [Gammaproteobacteria bacterium]